MTRNSKQLPKKRSAAVISSTMRLAYIGKVQGTLWKSKLITRTEVSETFLGVIGMNLSTHNSIRLSSLFLQNAPINTLRLVFLYSLTIYPPRSNDIIRTQCSLLLRGVQIWAENSIPSRLTPFLSVFLNSFISLTCAYRTQICRLSPHLGLKQAYLALICSCSIKWMQK